MKVAVLGAAGGIGQALALLFKTNRLQVRELSCTTSLQYPGVAVDLSHNIPTAVKKSKVSPVKTLNSALEAGR
ncbi:hypothetical protein KCP71_09255 [Salmonella enterica subsp. enterica]|nr:hypothetical protein KCP71_09255 [Salmonella enterica subsp. enterica]